MLCRNCAPSRLRRIRPSARADAGSCRGAVGLLLAQARTVPDRVQPPSQALDLDPFGKVAVMSLAGAFSPCLSG